MIIPASIRFKGTYDIVLRDTITGKIKDKRKIDNMLLNGFKRLLLDDLLTLQYSSFYPIIIGTDNTPPSRSDTGIIGTSLASESGTTQISSLGEYPFTLTKTVTFPAGVGTGSIGEIVFQFPGSTTIPSYGLSRIALDPKIDKTDTDELIITYTLTAHRLADVISGTIPGGQRDGVTDIDWKLTFNNEQFYYFLSKRLSTIPGIFSNVILGDSNADSDLINDKHNTLKGNQIASFTPFHYEWLQYSPENDYRDLVLGFEKDQGKGNIAEIVLINWSGQTTGVCRVTFDPPLDNTDPNYRLYLTFRFYIELGETDVTIEGNNNNG